MIVSLLVGSSGKVNNFALGKAIQVLIENLSNIP